MTGKAVDFRQGQRCPCRAVGVRHRGGKQFYIYSHPRTIKSVQTRLEDVLLARNPTDHAADKPEIGQQLRAALRAD